MVSFIFVCCLLNFAAGIYLVLVSQTISQQITGGICLVISTLLFIGGATIYKLDKIIDESKKRT